MVHGGVIMKKAAILFAILTMSIPCAAINDPVAHWKLDEVAGLTAYDSAGSNDGTLINDPCWVAGQINGALDFDGSDDHVDLGNAVDIKVPLPVTICSWINISQINEWNIIIQTDYQCDIGGGFVEWWVCGGKNRYSGIEFCAFE